MSDGIVYRATHTTRYHYEAPVSQCQSEVRLTPRSLPWQTVLESEITTTPGPTSQTRRKDYFGNEVGTFSVIEIHDRFATVARSLVRVEPRPEPVPEGPAWEAVRADLVAHATPAALEAFEYVFDSPYVASASALAEYARPSFGPGRPVIAGAGELSSRIHAEFEYKPKSTTIDTPLLEALEARRGVCQDFAHVMIGALRSLGLAARYVSGYVRSSPEHQGAEASHAWVAVFCPEAGWVEFDPTNDVIPGTGHITLAWGRDYGDVTPVKGIALGGGNQVVEVEVRVEPEDPAE